MKRQYCPVSEILNYEARQNKVNALQQANTERMYAAQKLAVEQARAAEATRPVGDPVVAIDALIAATISKPRKLATYSVGSNAGGGGGLAFTVATAAAAQIIANLRAAGAAVSDQRNGDTTVICVKTAIRVNQNEGWPVDGPTWKRFSELESAAQAWNRPANWQAGANQRLYELDHKSDTPERSIIRRRIQAGIDSAKPRLDGLTELEAWEAGYRWLDTWHIALAREQRNVGDLGVTLCGDRLGPNGRRLCGSCANRWAEDGGSEPMGCCSRLE